MTDVSVWEPCTLDALPGALSELHKERRRLQGEIDTVERILLDASVKGADMTVDPYFRTGEVIGKDVKVYAVWRMGSDGVWEPKLRYWRGDDNGND